MKKGFTLIELLVVVLIIGILSAIALPQYQVAVAKARVMPLVSMMRSIDSAQQVYKLANGEYATDLADLDIQSPANIVPYQFISDGKAMSVVVSEPKSGISLEKYYNRSYFHCWVNKNNALQVKICQSISGKTTATGGDGGEIYSYYTF